MNPLQLWVLILTISGSLIASTSIGVPGRMTGKFLGISMGLPSCIDIGCSCLSSETVWLVGVIPALIKLMMW